VIQNESFVDQKKNFFNIFFQRNSNPSENLEKKTTGIFRSLLKKQQ